MVWLIIKNQMPNQKCQPNQNQNTQKPKTCISRQDPPFMISLVIVSNQNKPSPSSFSDSNRNFIYFGASYSEFHVILSVGQSSVDIYLMCIGQNFVGLNFRWT